MKNILKITMCLVLVMSSAPALVSAGTIAPGHKGSVKPVNEVDPYNPNSDPLPNWLLLPAGVDENALQFASPVASPSQTITYQNGTVKWIIQIVDNKKVTYSYYKSDVLKYSLKTTSTYSTVIIYDSSGKKVQSVNGQDFINDDFTLKTPKLPRHKGKGPVAQAAGPRDWPGDPFFGQLNQLSKRQLNDLAASVGFKNNGRRMAVAIALAESDKNHNSKGHVGAVLCNKSSGAFNPSKEFEPGVRQCKSNGSSSIDRGLWQINSYWHKNVSDSCSFSSMCNAKAAYKISNGGRDWSPWSTYQNGSYRQYL